MQAAIGCAQLERIDELVKRKRYIYNYYSDRLLRLKGIAMNPEETGTANGYWMPTVVFDEQTGVTRALLQAAFLENHIDARVFFHPLSSLPPFENGRNCHNPHAASISSRALNLPSYHDLTNDDMDAVVRTIINLGKGPLNG